MRQYNKIADADYLRLKANYLSDENLLEDFFEEESRQGKSPENYFVYTHRGVGYSADLLLQTRLNDFFDTVERIPQFSFDVMRQEIGETFLFYESKSSAAFLRREFAESADQNNNYSAFRLDSWHMIYRPSRHFGFLNFIPRGGIRETYFSKTRKIEYYQGIIQMTNEQGVVTNIVVDKERYIDAGSALRSLPELGCELSYKAFSTWGEPDFPMRHVIQPYLDYTIIPEPSVKKEELYQFDSIDKIDQTHEVKIGMRNKYQTKIDDKASDFADINTYTIYKIHREEGEDAISHFYYDAEFDPLESVKIRSDGIYSLQNSEFEKLNAELQYESEQMITLHVEYRYLNLKKISRLLSTDLTFFEEQPWSFNIFGRYEFEDSHMEEQGGYIQRNYDCLSVRTGYSILPGYTCLLYTSPSPRDS